MQITCKLLANYLQITCKLLANYLQITCKFLALLSFSFGAYAQQSPEKGNLLSFSSFDRTYTPAEATTLLHKVLPTDGFTTFVPYKTETDQLGYTHTAFQQYYRGVKVQHGEYVVHSQKGQITYINGAYKNLVGSTLASPLSLAACKEKVTEQLGKARAEAQASTSHTEDHATTAEKAELVWWGWGGDAAPDMPQKFRLAYFFEVHALHAVVYADAYTGEILNQSSTICSFVGDANTRYSGTQKINTRQISPGVFKLIAGDDKNFNIISVKTTNAKKINMIDDDGNWTEADYAANGDDVALDAHWGGMQAQNYWDGVHGRNGYDGQGSTLNIVARAGNEDNSFWNNSNKTAYFHDGANIHKPLVTLDIIGHEVGHGFNWSFGLNSTAGGETAALHEGFADIWGICLRRGSWQIGDQVMRSAACLRNLALPEDPNSLNKGENTYQGTDWNVLEKHGKGLVLGHWFYRLSVGGTGTNDFGNSFSVRGIGLEVAEKIAYRMCVAGYLTSGATYRDIPQAARRAAADLYGECSEEVASVVAALFAVGLLDSPLVGFTEFHAWQNFVCDINPVYYFAARVRIDRNFTQLPVLPNSIFHWELSNGRATGLNGRWQSSTVTNNYSVTVNFMPPAFPDNVVDGYWETLTATPLQCTPSAPASYRFWVGRPAPIGALSQDYLCMGYTNNLSIEEVDGATGYEWYVNPADAVIRARNRNTAYIIPLRKTNIKTPIKVYVRATNYCSLPVDIDKGQRTYRMETFDLHTVDYCKDIPDCPKGGMCIEKVELPISEIVGYPNPASNSYTFGWQGTESKMPYDFVIYNNLGVQLLQGSQSTGENKTIDVSQWADGLYLVQIQIGNQTQYIKFLVQKGRIAN